MLAVQGGGRGSRLRSLCIAAGRGPGYSVEPSYFVTSGTILDAASPGRAKKFINSDGSFADARFEKKDKSVVKMSHEGSWSYEANPFAGTKELNGLKVMIMTLSNRDSGDALQSCGATPSEQSCFLHAVRTRISALQALC
ncbi:MAG TPA: hypothetical protein VFV34_27470 [Blastocatellia bacterium]|nr:hypothetical protein [Blastocatellia bacterium]